MSFSSASDHGNTAGIAVSMHKWTTSKRVEANRIFFCWLSFGRTNPRSQRKCKFTAEQATKAQGWSRVIVSLTSAIDWLCGQAHAMADLTPVPIALKAELAPETVSKAMENFAPHRDSVPLPSSCCCV
jgi:hypothetical protein